METAKTRTQLAAELSAGLGKIAQAMLLFRDQTVELELLKQKFAMQELAIAGRYQTAIDELTAQRNRAVQECEEVRCQLRDALETGVVALDEHTIGRYVNEAALTHQKELQTQNDQLRAINTELNRAYSDTLEINRELIKRASRSWWARIWDGTFEFRAKL